MFIKLNEGVAIRVVKNGYLTNAIIDCKETWHIQENEVSLSYKLFVYKIMNYI
jgi:hypothetical protein